MKNPLIIPSESFQSALVSTPLTDASFLEFGYNHINEDDLVACQGELPRVKHNDFQSLESRKLNKV